MTNPISLSGYTAQPAMEQQHLTWKNPAWWIQEAVQDLSLALATQKGDYIETQLSIVSLCAQDILNSVGPRRAVDAQGVLIDNSTQSNELIQLSQDLRSIANGVRASLKDDRNVTRYGQGFFNKLTVKKRLTGECNSLDNFARRMTEEAAGLQKQIKADTKALTDELLEDTPLPTDVLGIIAQYSIL